MKIEDFFYFGMLKVVSPVVRRYKHKRLLKDSYAHFRTKFMDPHYPWKRYMKTRNAYFAKWGFDVSDMECIYFEKCSGIHSDIYIPFYIWKNYIYSYLNQDAKRFSYADKNMFQRLLQLDRLSSKLDITLPQTIVSNMCGIYYKNGDTAVTQEDCVAVLSQMDEDVIIKPTVESLGGKGIACVNFGRMDTASIIEVLGRYGDNFDIQRKLVQHPVLASFNPTSINTLRIATYLDFSGNVKVLYVIQRFGKEGAVVDNASSGGGYCGVTQDGYYMNQIHHHKRIQSEIVEGLPKRVPYYEKCVKAVTTLHLQLPQFRIIGWDVTVDPEGHIGLMEYNFSLGYNLPQTSVGPIFTREELDEIMEHVSKASFSIDVKCKVSHPDRPSNDYYV